MKSMITAMFTVFSDFSTGNGSDATLKGKENPQNEIQTEFIFEAKVTIDNTLVIGPSGRGRTQLVPITGGTFEGPRIKGTVVPGGADWQWIRPDGVMMIEARYTIKTDDGALISVFNSGMAHAIKNDEDKPKLGKSNRSSSFYARTVPCFDAPIGPYDWLNKSIFVGTLAVGPPSEKYVIVRVYRVF